MRFISGKPLEGMSQNMEANDNAPKTDQINRPLEANDDAEEDELDDDTHVCKKCNLEFRGIQKYLEHKIKHDNFRVKYGRSEMDKRMIVPTLVQKVKRKTLQEVPKVAVTLDEEKENDTTKKKGRRGRKKASEVLDTNLVITEKPVYSCEKCHKRFNREATLRRHIQYDHNEDDLEEEENENVEDDRDEDYKPNTVEIKEQEIMEQQDEEGLVEMDSLDQVIMAAALMEKAEGSTVTTQTVSQTVSITTDSGAVINAVITEQITNNQPEVVPVKQRQHLSEEEKALRKFVCDICGNKFKDINVLKGHSLTHTSHREFVCTYDDCPYSFKTKGSLKRHLRRHTGERPYPCELCGRHFAESGALTRHLKSRTPCTAKSDNDLPRYGKKWTYTPNIPAVTSSSRKISLFKVKDMRSGMEVDINKDTMIQEVSEVSEVSLPVDDGGNKEQFSSMSSVVQVLEETLPHDTEEEFFDIDQDGGEEIVIERDGDVITDDTIGQFVQYENSIPDTVAKVCKVCGEELASIEALKIHLRTHLADQTCRCWLCHFNTEDKEQFENHMFMHHHVQIKNSDPLLNIIPLEPDIKEAAVEAKTKDNQENYKDAQVAVKQLMEIPEDAKNQPDLGKGTRLLFKCPICMRKFRGSNYLKLHMRNHTGIRPYKCSECDKSFITKDTLNKHMSSHEEDRNFKCGECGKLFKRLSHVREHIKIHTGLRPFTCTVCGKGFKTNNAMKVHLRTHSEILPYECTFCHRRFREKGSVLRHTRMHTGEKPYECCYCGRLFAEHGTLNRHLKAKVSCTKQLQELRDRSQDDTDHTVLAEFSSVVADTQQYIIPEGEVDSTNIQETLVQDNILHSTDGSELHLVDQNDEQQTEYVLVQTGGDETQVQNLEIVTSEEGHSLIEGVQIADDYIMITESDGQSMKIMDSKTGQVVAIVPVASGGNGDEVQTITLPQDGVISAVTMDTDIEVPTETVTMEEFIEIAGTVDESVAMEIDVGKETEENNDALVETQN